MSPLDFDPSAIPWNRYDAYREVVAHPADFAEERFTIPQLYDAARRSQILYRGWPFIFYHERFTQTYNDRVETIVDLSGLRPFVHFERWEIRQSGLFFHKQLMDEETYDQARRLGRILGFEMTVYHISEAIGSLWHLYEALGVPEDETVSLEFRYTGAKGRRVQVLDLRRGHIFTAQECMEDAVQRRREAPLSVWRSADAELAAEIAMEVFQRFGWLDASKEGILNLTREFLAKPQFGRA